LAIPSLEKTGFVDIRGKLTLRSVFVYL